MGARCRRAMLDLLIRRLGMTSRGVSEIPAVEGQMKRAIKMMVTRGVNMVKSLAIF